MEPWTLLRVPRGKGLSRHPSHERAWILPANMNASLEFFLRVPTVRALNLCLKALPITSTSR
jgi:hypothetical protein